MTDDERCCWYSHPRGSRPVTGRASEYTGDPSRCRARAVLTTDGIWKYCKRHAIAAKHLVDEVRPRRMRPL